MTLRTVDKIQALAIGGTIRLKLTRMAPADVQPDPAGFWAEQLDPENTRVAGVAQRGKKYRCTNEPDGVVLIERVG